MKRLIKSSEDVFCMSNVRGIYVKHPYRLPFSFYFSSGQGDHEIRVKPIFNPSRMIATKAGTLMLHSDWEFTPGSDDKHISPKDKKIMFSFFRQYILLFCMVWDEQMSDATLADYFEGRIELPQLLEDFDDYDSIENFLDTLDKNLSDEDVIHELTEYCRKHKLVDLRNN